jgi:hypothetical protein
MHFGLGAGLLQEEPQRTDRHEIRIAILNRRRRRLPRPLYSLLPCFIERVDTSMFGERFQDRGQSVRREVGGISLIVRNHGDPQCSRRDRLGEIVCDHVFPVLKKLAPATSVSCAQPWDVRRLT